MQNHHRLDDLLARDVDPRWFEGVAVVQLICRQLRAQNAGGSGFPRAADILIGRGGSIAIAGGSDGNPVQAAAHVLALMLSDDVPVRLRLAVSQATATESGYATLADFSEALAYFERPNPEAIVDAFRQRALTAAPREIAPPKPIEATPASEKHPAPVRVAPPRRVSRLAVIAAMFAAVACASVWLMARATEVSAPEIVKVDTPERTVPPHASRAKVATNAEPAAPSRAAIGTRTTTAADVAVTPRRAARDRTPELQVIAESVSYRYPELSLSAPTLGASETTHAELATSANTGAWDQDIEAVPDRIYSRADSQVTLPLSVYPKLPPDTPGFGVTGRTILELTIARDGLVERVKMLTAPRNIHEFMLLSAAKAWRFEPAKLAGHPVRFRHTIVLTAMP